MDEPRKDIEQSGAPQFMDIQPPRPNSSAQPSSVPQQSTEVVEVPQYVNDDQSLNPTEEPAEATPLVAQPAEHGGHHRAPIGAILVAVVVAVGLGAVSVVAYNNTKPQSTATTQSTPQQVEEKVKPEEVDQTSKEIDTTLNEVNEATDLNSEELSDSSLNL